MFDEEALAFAKQVIDVLKASNFEVIEGAGPLSFDAKGAWIVVKDLEARKSKPNALGAIQAVFKDALGILLDGASPSPGFPDEPVIIAIGAKP